MTKLILFSRRVRNTKGGVELFNENLMELLNGSAVHVSERSADEPLIRSYLTRLRGTAHLCKDHQDAVVLVQYGSFLDILAIPIIRLFSRKIFVIAHVSGTWRHLSSFMPRLITSFIIRKSCKKLLVLADVQKDLFESLNPVKVHTIIHPAFADKPLDHGLNRIGFVFVGRITREKGVFDLLDAWRLLGQAAPELRLYGNGDAVTIDDLRNVISQYDLENKVFLCGPIADPISLRRVYRGAKATVYPSYTDAFPLVMLESISQMTPCIISRVGEVPYFLNDHRWLIEPGDISQIATLVAAVEEGSITSEGIDVYSERAASYAKGAIVEDLRHAGV